MRVLIIGLGGIGQRHVRNLRALLGSNVELLAYRVRRLKHMVTPSLQVDATRNVEQEYDLKVVADLETALTYNPRIAFVCNPSSLHVPAALACARAGCDLFLEKPISNDLEGVRELIQDVESRRLVAMVGYQLRFHPCFQRLAALIKSGAVGRPLAVRSTVGEYLPGWHAYEDYRQMYAARRELGGGVILSQIHEFDYLYSLFGLPCRVFSLGGHLSGLEIDVEDVSSTIMEYIIDGRPAVIHLHQDYVQRPPSRQCEVIGDTGKVIVDFSALRLTAYNQSGHLIEDQLLDGFERNQLFLDELRHFLHCVETRQRPIVDLRDGMASLCMALAAKESITTGRVIDFRASKEVSA